MDKYWLYAPRGRVVFLFLGPKIQVDWELGRWVRWAAGAKSCISLDFDGTGLIYLCSGSGSLFLSEPELFFSGCLTYIFVCIELSVSSHPFPKSCLSRFGVWLYTDWIYLSDSLFFLKRKKNMYFFWSQASAVCFPLVPKWLGWNVGWKKRFNLFTGVFPTNLTNSSFSDQD